MPSKTANILDSRSLHWGVFIPVGGIILCGLISVGFMFYLSSMLKTFVGTIALPPFHLWILIGAGVLSILAFAVIFAKYRRFSITLTSEHLKFKTGFLSLTSGEMALENIESMVLFQPLLGRILGYGTLRVTGNGGTPFRFTYLPNVTAFHAAIQSAITQARKSITSQAPPRPPLDDDSRYMPKSR